MGVRDGGRLAQICVGVCTRGDWSLHGCEGTAGVRLEYSGYARGRRTGGGVGRA